MVFIVEDDSTRIKARDGRDDMPIFIHSELDDYPLTPIEFRVYARLARRCGKGKAHESVPNMARDFSVSDRTVQRALRLLRAARLIGEQQRDGKTTLYTLLSRLHWTPGEQLSTLRKETLKQAEKQRRVVTPETGVGVTPEHRVTGDTRAGGDTTAGGGVTPQPGVGVTPQPDEGSPSEGTPLKVLPKSESVDARAEKLLAFYGQTVKPIESVHCDTLKRWTALIRTRLLEGWEDAQLARAFKGCSLDDWKERWKFNDVPHVLKDRETIERFIEYAEKMPEKAKVNGKQRNQSKPADQLGPRTKLLAERDYSVFRGRE